MTNILVVKLNGITIVFILFLYFNSGFSRDPTTSKYEIYGYVDQFSLVGQYKVDGKILILPVVGSGIANLTLGNFDIC